MAENTLLDISNIPNLFSLGGVKIMKFKVVQYGLGPIGCGTAKAVLEHPELELVGAVDIDPEKAGLDLGGVLGLPDTGIKIKTSLAQVMAETKADIAVHCTGSVLPRVSGQILELLEAGLHVISTCEELSWPWYRYPELAAEIDRAAKKAGKVVTGTGVNPGFVMDLLPLVLANASLGITAVKVHRVLDAGKRRGPLQKKVGAGMDKEDFLALAREAKNGHAGFIESVAMLGAGLGWKLDDIQQEILPMLADQEYKTDVVHIKAGQVTGIDQYARGYSQGKEVISLHLQMYVGAPESFDKIWIEGSPDLELHIVGGTPGDRGTVCSTLTTLFRAVRSGKAGLVAVKDLPGATY